MVETKTVHTGVSQVAELDLGQLQFPRSGGNHEADLAREIPPYLAGAAICSQSQPVEPLTVERAAEPYIRPLTAGCQVVEVGVPSRTSRTNVAVEPTEHPAAQHDDGSVARVVVCGPSGAVKLPFKAAEERLAALAA